MPISRCFFAKKKIKHMKTAGVCVFFFFLLGVSFFWFEGNFSISLLSGCIFVLGGWCLDASSCPRES